MTDNTELKRLAEAANAVTGDASVNITISSEPGPNQADIDAVTAFVGAATPAAVLALIAESEALKGPHDWLAEDLIKELVDNAQSFQENSCEEGEDPFVIVLLAAASRIRRQEANLDQLKTENKRLVPFEEAYGTACNVRNRLIRENELLDQLIVHNKALSDSFRAERDQLKAENERLRADYAALATFNPEWDRVAAAQDSMREHMDMVTQLRAEVAGLKTGYEAYERVNAQMKAENEALRKECDARHPFKPFHEPAIGFTGCVICGVYTDHGGLPCPKTRATADAAMGKGEQS